MSVSHSDSRAAGTRAAAWNPAVDIVERADRFELTADLPGVCPEDIDVSLDGKVLRLSGQRESGAANGKPHRGERATGRFCRLFELPETVDGERIEARAQHGTLQLSIPKNPVVLPRRIAIDSY